MSYFFFTKYMVEHPCVKNIGENNVAFMQFGNQKLNLK